MKKIIFIVGSLAMGGAERVISNLANYYSNREYEVHIIILLRNIVEYELNEDIQVHNLSRADKQRVKNIKHWILGMREIIKNVKPDYIISFVARINILSFMSNLFLDYPIIVSERNDPKNDGRGLITNLFTRFLYPLTDKVVFQTTFAASCFSDKIVRNSMIISNPIDVPERWYENDSKRIISVGRLAEQKNHELLINSFALFCKQSRYVEFKLDIYGEGELKDSLETLIKDLGMCNNIRIINPTKNIHQEISKSTLFIMTSRYEGQSNALLEAIAIGIPIITTDYNGLTEVIENDINGIVVSNSTSQQICDALVRLVETRNLQQLISTNNIIKSMEYSSESIFSMWDNLLLNIDKQKER